MKNWKDVVLESIDDAQITEDFLNVREKIANELWKVLTSEDGKWHEEGIKSLIEMVSTQTVQILILSIDIDKMMNDITSAKNMAHRANFNR